MSKTFYVNLFHNGLLKYSGFKKSLENADTGGKRPVMIPVNSFRSAVRFPYKLDEEKNIKKFSSGSVEVAFLVPTSDVENLSRDQFENSLYYKLVGDQGEEVEKLRDRLQNKEDVIGRLRKQKRRLEAEEEERDKGGSTRSGSKSLSCPSCGESSSKTQWENNRSLCPKCDMSSMDDPEVVRE